MGAARRSSFSSSIAFATTILALFSFQLISINAQTISDTHVALFIFGDSLYDVGMNAYYKKGTLGTHVPYGETYFKKPTGRYSDGRLVPDYIAQFAQLPFLPAYLQPGLSDYTNGVNFAAAGACVLVETRPGTINMKMQVDYFLQMVEKLKKQIGDAQTNKLLKQAVYLFSIGGNDYASLVSSNINKPTLSPSYKRQYINMVLANLTSHVHTIYNEGGTKFAFQNVGPIGCMPSTKQIYANVGQNVGNCAKEPQILAKTHNAFFLAIAKKLQTQLSGFKYSVFDYYAQAEHRVLYNTRYGFKESKVACCGSGQYNGAFTCGSTTVKFNQCGNPSDYLWFDAAHPTDKANGQYAQMFWSGASNVVGPYTLKNLFDMH